MLIPCILVDRGVLLQEMRMLDEDSDDRDGAFADELDGEGCTSLRTTCVLGSMNMAVGQSMRNLVFMMSL